MKPTTLEEVNNPNNVEVFTEDRYLTKSTARLVSRRTLVNKAKKYCEEFQKGICRDCEIEKEVDCIWAWTITKGTGKKLY